MNRIRFQVFLLVIIMMTLVSCQQSYAPKPHAYYRIDFPEREYRLYDGVCPFTFEYPEYGTIIPDARPTSESYWMNIIFPKYKGTVHLTYLEINNNFDELIENDWKVVYKGIAQKADAVGERLHYDPDGKVYGIMYDIEGNAASQLMFFVTDSVKNYLRGSLYFYTRPNHDSLAPVVSFFREDIVHLMKTVRWKEIKAKK